MEGGLGETPPPLDVWLREFTEQYPASGRCANHLTETAFCAVILDAGSAPAEAYRALCGRLAGHIRSHQWRVKRMIPRLDRYLRDGLHRQELPEQSPSAPPGGRPGDKTAGNEDAIRAFVERRQP